MNHNVNPPQKRFCIYCDPYEVSASHILEKIDAVLARLVPRSFPNLGLPRKAQAWLRSTVLRNLFSILLSLGIMKEVSIEDTDEGIYNRSRVIAQEAASRGITVRSIRLFGRSTAHFSLQIDSHKEFFEVLPHVTSGYIATIDFDDKAHLKSVLSTNKLPVARGRAFKYVSEALYYIRQELNYPLVVKPRAGSLSKHTVCNIHDETELREAFRIAQIISREVIVEEYIPGKVYRATIVDGTLVAVCEREKAHVIGDGYSSIEELIKVKNTSNRRGPLHKKNYTLHHLTVSEKTHALLRTAGLAITSVPATRVKVYVHDKILMTAGADIHDVTDLVHSEIADILKKVYELCKAPIIGIDCIFDNIARSPKQQRCAILEVNSIPYIDMHHFPSTGKPRNVAGALLDYCVKVRR